MRGATDCAKRLRKLFASLRNRLGKVQRPAAGDPITQLVLGILTRDAQESKAREALDKMLAIVVDYNELRVIPSPEIAKRIGDYPDGASKSEDIIRALNRIFAIEHQVSLDRFATASMKDTNLFLDRIHGLEAYTRARVKLLGLDKHAIPLDEAMWALVRDAEIVDPKCTLEEAQAFIERNIHEGDEAHEFVALLRKQAWTDYGAAVRKRDVQPIRAIPPDRTSSNMLAVLAAGGTLDEPDVSLDEDAELAEMGDGTPAAAGAAAGKKGKSKGESAKPAKAAPAGRSERGKKPDRKPRPQSTAARSRGKSAAR